MGNMLTRLWLGSKVTKEAKILQEGFSRIFCRVKLLPDSNILVLIAIFVR